MARIIISNIPKVVDIFVKHCEEVGFRKYQRLETGSFYGAIFKKTCIEHTNYMSFGDDFISCIGTFFYNGLMNDEALSQIFKDYNKNEDIVAIRDRMIGHFVLCIKRGHVVRIVTDAMGIHYCHYYYNEETGEYIISNMLYEMARFAPMECHVSEFNLLQEMHLACVGEDTLFDELKNLTGERVCEINLQNDSFSLIPVPYRFEIDKRNLEEITIDLVDIIRRHSEIIKMNFGNDVAICMTGGIDARTTLAAFLGVKIKPHLYYGVGNSSISYTEVDDLKVDHMLANEFGLSIELMNYKNEVDITGEWENCIEKYGLLDHFSTVTPNLKKSFEKIGEPIVFWNFFGELFRNPTYSERRNQENISLGELVDSKYYQITDSIKRVLRGDYDKYRAYMETRLSRILSPYLNEKRELPFDYTTIYEYYMRVTSDVHKMNLCNQHRFSLALLGNRDIAQYAMIPLTIREDAKLQLAMIRDLCASTLDVPFFSHSNYRKYNSENNTMDILAIEDRANIIATHSVKEKVSKFLKTLGWYNFFIKIYHSWGHYKQKGLLASERVVISNESITSILNKWYMTYPYYHRVIKPEESDYIVRECHLGVLLLAMHKLGIHNVQLNK